MDTETVMTMKIIPETDLNVSEYCLGTMYFGTKVGKGTSFRLLDIFVGMGGNFLDSANKYASWVPGFSGGASCRKPDSCRPLHRKGDDGKNRKSRQIQHQILKIPIRL